MKRVTAILVATCVATALAAAQAQTADEKGKPGGVPKIIKKVDPRYPADAKKERVQGAVLVDVGIDKNGKVTEAIASKSPDERLSKAAIDAVKQWEFEPAKMDGKPVDVKATITINFRLK